MVCRSGNTLLVVLLAALVLSPGAAAWAWPVDGPVLRPFVSEGDPYAGGQHRGIDIGAPTGSDVHSAARGVVAFAGRLPRQGLCLTVRTEDGWSVTLVHLGSIGLPVGTEVSEGDVVGTIGPSGEPEGTEPYVYLGIRLTADPNGYVDPLTLLPPRQAPEQVPPVQQTSQVQPLAPPVAERQPGPPRSAPRRRHSAEVKARVPQRSAATPRPATAHAAASPMPKPPLHPARTQHAWRAPSRVRAVRVRSSRAQHSAAQRTRAREPQERRADVVAHGVATRPVTPVTEARPGRSRRMLLIPLGVVGLALVGLGVAGRHRRQPVVARRFVEPPLRKMSETEPAPEERLPEPSTTAHSHRRRVALREWPAASGACRRLRRSVGHHGPVSPAAGRRRPDGQRHRRARHARHGRGRSRGSILA
jgi:hypothetical protein